MYIEWLHICFLATLLFVAQTLRDIHTSSKDETPTEDRGAQIFVSGSVGGLETPRHQRVMPKHEPDTEKL